VVLVDPLTFAVRRINNSTQKYLFVKFATNCSIFCIFFALIVAKSLRSQIPLDAGRGREAACDLFGLVCGGHHRAARPLCPLQRQKMPPMAGRG
jgi:hypothetical protein